MRKYIFFFALALPVLLAPTKSMATTQKGLFKLSLDSTFFRFGTGEVDFDDGPEDDFDTATVGIGMHDTSISFGFTVIPGLVIGGRVTFGLQGFDFYQWDHEVFVWSVLPYVEYVFLDGVPRPFVMGIAGFEGMNSDDFDMWWWGFKVGGGGGAHFFVMDRLSLDAFLLLAFDVGTGEIEVPGDDVDFSHWRFSVSTLVGMSAWF